MRCADGFELPATAFEAGPPRAVAVVAAGLGVPRRYYGRFAGALAERGIAAITFEYRGIGDAAGALKNPRAVRFQDWGRLDLDAVLAAAYARHPGVPVFLVGHSAGAQVVGLAPQAEKLAGMVFVAGPRPHVSQDRGAYRIFSTLWWYVLVPLLSLGRWFPSRRLGFSSVDAPSGVTAEWGRWARSPRYLFSPEHGIDTSRYRSFTLPLLAYSFTDDPYTPPRSAEGLLSEYPNVQLTRRHVSPSEAGVKAIGHAGYFKEGLRDTLWAETAAWISKVSGSATERARALA